MTEAHGIPIAYFAIATLDVGGHARAALVVDGLVYELAPAAAAMADREHDPSFLELRLANTKALLDRWDALLPLLRRLADRLRTPGPGDAALVAPPSPISLADARLLAPVPAPGKMINVGLNFRDHAAEMGMVVDESVFVPNFFFKGDHQCIIGPSQAIRPSSDYVDWEAELAVVIGRAGKNIPAANALDHVAGYTCHNDITDRRLMMRPDGGLDFFGGKSRDTFAPLGPWIMPVEFVADPGSLGIRCLLNGEVMQDTSTANMFWGVERCIAYVSSCVTLAPGDVIALGTGSGTGWAKGIEGEHTLARLVQNLESGGGVFLRPGDRIAVEIAGVGRLENVVKG